MRARNRTSRYPKHQRLSFKSPLALTLIKGGYVCSVGMSVVNSYLLVAALALLNQVWITDSRELLSRACIIIGCRAATFAFAGPPRVLVPPSGVFDNLAPARRVSIRYRSCFRGQIGSREPFRL